MRKIIEQGVVTLDGVISTPQEWVVPNWSGEYEAISRDLLFSVDALLYGRVSYEAHAQVWPGMEEGYGEYAVRMNSLPKHVASRTLRETTWNATLIDGDVAEGVAKLKEQPGGTILKVGTGGELSRTLLEHRLVDEYLFWLFPTIAGGGERLYDGIPTTHLKLVDVKRIDSGILGLTYVPK
ncbi:dihydrofolate reductase family protein [Nonomuraea harbinensis]|uniref:Dihydrofolate reductase family protein n=1 Tax=Nonomuraea harbinensis TaxID=1286938 RepID=A0ABW1BMT4_9ACTN|nr:dihydrofolate reductase family protein [Nonomuraea harbinensis]